MTRKDLAIRSSDKADLQSDAVLLQWSI